MPSAPASFSVAGIPPSPSASATSPSSSYTQAYANPERSSSVAIRRFAPRTLEKLAAFAEKQLHTDDSYPRFVLPAPNGMFALMDPSSSAPMQVLNVGGKLAKTPAFGPAGFVVSDEGYADVRERHA